MNCLPASACHSAENKIDLLKLGTERGKKVNAGEATTHAKIFHPAL